MNDRSTCSYEKNCKQNPQFLLSTKWPNMANEVNMRSRNWELRLLTTRIEILLKWFEYIKHGNKTGLKRATYNLSSQCIHHFFSNEFQEITTDQTIDISNYSGLRKTKFIIPGYLVNGDEDWPQDMCKVYCSKLKTINTHPVFHALDLSAIYWAHCKNNSRKPPSNRRYQE